MTVANAFSCSLCIIIADVTHLVTKKATKQGRNDTTLLLRITIPTSDIPPTMSCGAYVGWQDVHSMAFQTAVYMLCWMRYICVYSISKCGEESGC